MRLCLSALLLGALTFCGCTQPIDYVKQQIFPEKKQRDKLGGTGKTDAPQFANDRAGALLRKATAPYVGLRTVEASAKLKARDDKTYTFNAQILVERPGNLHIAATKAMGIEAFELAMIGESLEVWLPRSSKLYRGLVSDISDGEMNFHPDEIVGQLLVSPEHFSALKWRVTKERDGMVELSSGDTRQGETVLIDAMNGDITKRRIIRDGACTLEVNLSSYQKTDDGQGPRLPHRLIINFPKEKRELTIVLVKNKTYTNSKMTPADFKVSVPETGVTVKPLKSADKIEAGEELRGALEDNQE